MKLHKLYMKLNEAVFSQLIIELSTNIFLRENEEKVDVHLGPKRQRDESAIADDDQQALGVILLKWAKWLYGVVVQIYDSFGLFGVKNTCCFLGPVSLQ